MRAGFPAALLVAAMTACMAVPPPPAAPPPSPSPATFVRLHNASRYALEDVRVTFRAVTVGYGDLAVGATSPYREAAGAYRYARIDARIDGEPFVLQPIDFVGETPLRPGRYTYRLVDWPDHQGFTVAEATPDD